jgi:uncharacterized protein YndB with AHSA1/START domain
MTEERAGARTHASRVIRARPEEIYEAFMNAAVLAAWLPPAGLRADDNEAGPRSSPAQLARRFE